MYLIPFDDSRPRLQNACLKRWHHFIETSIYPENHAQWRVNFHELLVLTGYTIKKGYFHDREKWWILIFQTYIYVAWWFSPRMSGYFAVIPVSNTLWVDEEWVQHSYTLSSSHVIPKLNWVSCRPWSTFGPFKQM